MSDENFTVEDADKLLLETLSKGAPTKEDAPIEENVEDVEATAPDTEETVEPAEEVRETQTPANSDDWLSGLSEDVRGKVSEKLELLAKAEQRIRSDDGRVRAFQKQAEDLKAKLMQLSAQNTPQQQTAAPTTPEEWQQLIEHDPVLAKAIEGQLEARVKAEIQELRRTTIDPLVAVQESYRQAGREELVQRERAKLEQIVPDAFSIIQQPMFQGWLDNEASPIMKRMVTESEDHRDYVAVFNQFAIDMINSGRITPDAPTESQPVIDPQKAKAISDNRERRLSQAPVSGKPVTPNVNVESNGPLTVEQADNMLLSLLKKRNNQR